jgi:hypothetical protein
MGYDPSEQSGKSVRSTRLRWVWEISYDRDRASRRPSLTLEDWLNQLASGEPSGERPLQTAADIVLSHMRKVPPEIMATMPKDGASQHDHYIYGRPKR